MHFFFVGIIVGVVFLYYGSKKGWLSGKIEMFEGLKDPKEKNIQDIVDEDKESIDPTKTLFEKFKERVEDDANFKHDMTKMNEKRREVLFRGLNPKDREMLENYLKEMVQKMKNQEGTAESYEGFRNYGCELFVLSALMIFLWWAYSRHSDAISPVTVGKVILDNIEKLLDTKNKPMTDL